MALENTLASLPNSLQPLILHYGRQIITCRSKLFNKIKMKKKLEDNEAYIPKLAHATAFKVTFSKDAAHNDRAEFLEQQAVQAKEIYEKSLRSIIDECITIEIEALTTKENEIVAEALHGLAKATATYHDANCDPHLRATNLIELDRDLFRLCQTKNTV